MSPIALLSVSNKEGLIPFAKSLVGDHGFSLVSSGGTAKLIEEAGLKVTRVSDYTSCPEILGGRVKTLHPKIHGGILAKLEESSHLLDLKQQNINTIDLVVVNLYPFVETIAKPNSSWNDAIENIDIGGPSMIRAAAKNHSRVSILTNPSQYPNFLNELTKNNGLISKETKTLLALEAFQHTAKYDVAISQWMNKSIAKSDSPFQNSTPHKQTLRYGENPHQSAKWFSNSDEGWGAAKQLQGKDLSTNNLLDLEAALATLREFGYGADIEEASFNPAAVIIKHTNPCGVAIGESLENAFDRALEADSISAFGGIVALNKVVNASTANKLCNVFLECVVAPAFDKEAQVILSKKPKLRLLELNPEIINKTSKDHVRSILGGFLVQEIDDQLIETKKWTVQTKKNPTPQENDDLIFAWKLVRHVHSNAIVVAGERKSLGIGAGQMNRIGSAKLALEAASLHAKGSVLASDGFFPFDDTVKMAADFGISSIIQPGGSIRDKDSIDACNQLGIKMIITGKRHFLH